MTVPNLRDRLLNQNGGFSVQAELSTLNDLLAEDRRRARRLAIWTAAIWAVWISMITVSLGLPIVMRAVSQRPPEQSPAPGAPSPRLAPAPTPPHGRGTPPLIGVIVGVVDLAGLFGLPVVGVLLLVTMVVGGRRATMSQIQVCLASIDSQLKQLASQKTPTTGPPG